MKFTLTGDIPNECMPHILSESNAIVKDTYTQLRTTQYSVWSRLPKSRALRNAYSNTHCVALFVRCDSLFGLIAASERKMRAKIAEALSDAGTMFAFEGNETPRVPILLVPVWSAGQRDAASVAEVPAALRQVAVEFDLLLAPGPKAFVDVVRRTAQRVLDATPKDAPMSYFFTDVAEVAVDLSPLASFAQQLAAESNEHEAPNDWAHMWDSLRALFAESTKLTSSSNTDSANLKSTTPLINRTVEAISL